MKQVADVRIMILDITFLTKNLLYLCSQLMRTELRGLYYNNVSLYRIIYAVTTVTSTSMLEICIDSLFVATATMTD